MIHPSAIIDPRAQIDPSAEIGPYVIIEGAVEIAAGVRIEAQAQLVGHVIVGEGCIIGRAAVIGAEPQDLSFDPKTDSGVRMGARNVIREHVTIHRSSKPGGMTTLGDGNFIMVGAHFAHDVQIGNQNVIANSALLAGHVNVGNHSFVGGGAVFHQFVRIGDYCMVQGNGGLGKDLPHYCVLQRINRLTGLNVVGLKRAGFTSAERAEIKSAFDLIFRSGRNLSQALAVVREKTWSGKVEKFIQFIEVPTKRGVVSLRRDAGES
jgi:UDP-N-acetylglucosamine acyltransferase